jgi:uncharacterized membrane protein YfcA
VKTAVAASAVGVIATSSMVGATSTSGTLAHVRLAMLLEIATTLGVLAGGFTAVIVPPRWLEASFGLVALGVAWMLWRRPGHEPPPAALGALPTSYVDPGTQTTVHYAVGRLYGGVIASFVAGNISGLLGIGGGVIKVPVMNLLMGVPLKAAIATSNFMIGITASAGALIFYQAGLIQPELTAATTLGILVGARYGTRLGHQASHAILKNILTLVLAVVAVQMLWRALHA